MNTKTYKRNIELHLIKCNEFEQTLDSVIAVISAISITLSAVGIALFTM